MKECTLRSALPLSDAQRGEPRNKPSVGQREGETLTRIKGGEGNNTARRRGVSIMEAMDESARL